MVEEGSRLDSSLPHKLGGCFCVLLVEPVYEHSFQHPARDCERPLWVWAGVLMLPPSPLPYPGR
eukprot:12729149-Prorocentrum_lima.AAC.1